MNLVIFQSAVLCQNHLSVHTSTHITMLSWHRVLAG